jgi:hypothetical protein
MGSCDHEATRNGRFLLRFLQFAEPQRHLFYHRCFEVTLLEKRSRWKAQSWPCSASEVTVQEIF